MVRVKGPGSWPEQLYGMDRHGDAVKLLFQVVFGRRLRNQEGVSVLVLVDDRDAGLGLAAEVS